MTDEFAVDPEAWVDRHGDSLYRYALLRLRRPDLAADIVQETFVAALQNADSFAGRATERTWLVGILRRKIVDHFRRNVRHEVSTNGVVADREFDDRGHWRVGPGAWPGDPSRDLETREFWDVFGRCLAKLPAGLADAFFLREVDELGADEVRELLGISPDNLWARLHRAPLIAAEVSGSGLVRPRADRAVFYPRSERFLFSMSPPRVVWHLLNLPCREMSRLSSESLDRELGRLERIALRLHRLYCTPCARYAQQIELLRNAVRGVVTRVESDDTVLGPGMPDDVRDRIKLALKPR